MKKTSNKGFTLVELIIVITILAILATIAFISFQGYSAETRDTKRVSDIGNMIKQVELKSTQGVSLLNFISGTGSQPTNPSDLKIGGTGSISGTDYKAGDVDLTALGAPENYTPNNGTGSYQMGATLRAGQKYQFATTMEKNQVAYVNGTYQSRDNTGSGIGFFYVGDYVTGNLQITKISSDMETLTLSDGSSTGVTNVTLALSESGSLIYNLTNEVTNGGSNKPANQGGL